MAWEETENQIRHRVRDPGDFREDTFRTKTLEGVKGVSIILGKLKPEKVPKDHDPDSMVVQAYRWDKSEGWTMKKAKAWFEEHRHSLSLKSKAGKTGLLYASAREIGPEPPGEFVLIKPGEVVYTNLKPHKKMNYTPEILYRIATNFAAQGQEKVIDYEHQTLKGAKAPAAGWIKELLFDPERGLIAKVKEWTKEAQEYLRNKEYRFISPVVDPSHIDTRTGENIGPVLHSVALTNNPLMYWLEPLVSKANQTSSKEEDEMELLQAIAEKVGLASNVSAEKVLEAIEELLEAKNRVASPEVLDLLGAKEGATLDDIKPLVAKLKAPQGKEPDPNLYVAKGEFDALQTKFTALEEERRDEKATLAVEDALLAGKLTPAQREWALDYAKTNPDGFAAFIAKAAQVVPLDQIVTGKGPKADEIPDEAQLLVNKQLGISQDDFQKYGQMAAN